MKGVKMKKAFKQLTDKAFVRPDRTEVLSEGLQEAEKRIDQIKIACESTTKKIQACLQGQGKDIDKRIRKTPEFVLGSAMVTSGTHLRENLVLGEILEEAGKIEMKLGHDVVEFEIKIEECVLKPLQVILEHDLPNIYKLKRQLNKLRESMDAAKAKLQQANRNSGAGGGTGRIENIKEEWEEAQQKMEQCRDNLATEMYALLARESEISGLIVKFLNYQKEYHKSTYDTLDKLVPEVEYAILQSAHKPVFGIDLNDHLTTTKRKIAYPIELCVCGLLETGLDEEGLFRIAGSTSKVKKLKSAFDAGILDLPGLLREFDDPHVMANALKSYLRDLPVPLLTSDLYEDWMNAIKITEGNEKLQALWTVVQKLPTTNRDNLSYLVRFLKELCKHKDVNKMSSANIAIVIGPNLLKSTAKADDFSGDNNPMGLNMTMTHHYSSVLDQLVSYCDYFFPEVKEIDFFVTCVKPTEQDVTGNRLSIMSNGLSGATSTIDESSEVESTSSTNMKRSQSCSSVDDQSPPHGSPKPVLRRKNKPAPVPPVAPTKTSPTPQRDNSVEKEQGAHLTKTNSFKNSNRFSQYGEPPSGRPLASPTVDKEKREGIWIPPSPSQLSNRKLNSFMGTDSSTSVANVSARPLSMAPPKPPQPQFDVARNRLSTLPVQPNEPPPRPSPLKYKSSFKTSNSVDSPTSSTPTEHSSPIRHNTTDNIDSVSGTGNSISNAASQFCSLPRHFSTENSYKNQRAPRPPSIFSVAPNVPPPQPPTAPISLPVSTVTPPTPHVVTEDGKKNSEFQIGFEKLENEVRKTSSDKSADDSSDEGFKNNASADSFTTAASNNNNIKPEKGPSAAANPPVPAPRVSLVQGSPPTREKDIPGQPPMARERPSIMAKPRDLPKRTQSQNKGVIGPVTSAAHGVNELNNSGSGGESDNPDGGNTSQSVVEDSSAGSHEDSEVCPNGGPKSLSYTNQQGPVSPTSKVPLPYRPPRPHPPPPPKVKPSHGESTDL